MSALALPFEILAGFLAILGWVAFNAKRRVVHTATVVVVIFSMLATPLLQSAQMVAFAKDVEQDQQKVEAAQDQRTQDRAAAQEYYNPNWNPQANPLEAAENLSAAKAQLNAQPLAQLNNFFNSFTAPAAAAASNVDDTAAADFDQDGLTDTYEQGFPVTVLDCRIRIRTTMD